MFTSNLFYDKMFLVSNTLSAWLNTEIAARHWTQSDLARKSGLHRAVISKILSESSKPNPETCQALAIALEIPIEQIFRIAQALLDELQRLESQQTAQQVSLTALESSSPLVQDIHPGELEKALAVLKAKLRGSPADCRLVLRSLVVSITVKRVGGSPIRHRSGVITGTMKLRLPLLDGENLLDVKLGE